MLLPRVNCYFYNCATPIWAATCYIEFNFVELHGTRCGGQNIPQIIKGTLLTRGHVPKTYPSGRVPATFSCVCLFLIHVLATRFCCASAQCALDNKFLLLKHAVVTCPCNMTPRVFYFLFFFNLFSIVYPKST